MCSTEKVSTLSVRKVNIFEVRSVIGWEAKDFLIDYCTRSGLLGNS